MSLELLKTRIKENNISGVFLLCGPEEYTKDHYADLLRKKVDSSPLPEFNHIYYNAASSKLCEFEDSVYSLPYMWEYKLIEITDLESAKITESDVAEYSRIFSDIPDYLTVLIVLRADEHTEEARNAKSAKSGLSGFAAAVSENGIVVEFKSEKADKLITWINRHFAAKDIKCDSGVPRELINICGTDMYILQSEILKLSEVYSGKPLTISDVRKYCCANSSSKYYDLVSALNRKDIVMAKRIFEELNIMRDDIPLAVGFLASNYSQMFIVKSGLDSGKSCEAIAKTLNQPQWKISKMASSLGSVDLKTISYAISQLSELDAKLKSFRGNPRRILEHAFYRICTYGRKA